MSRVLLWACVLLAVCALPVFSQPIPWCRTTSSVVPFPDALTPVTGFADDECEHFFVASAPANANATLTKVDERLNVVIQVASPIPADLLEQGYTAISDFEWNGGVLYVPVNNNNDPACVILMFDSETMAYKGATAPLPGVIVTTVTVDYGSRVLYIFGTGGMAAQGQYVITMDLDTQAFATVFVEWNHVDSGAVSGSILQQPGVLYLLVQENLYAGQPMMVYPLTINATGGSVNVAPIAQTVPLMPSDGAWSQTTGLANIWSIDGFPNLGELHVSDFFNMYNWAICSSSTKQEPSTPVRARSPECNEQRRRRHVKPIEQQ
jgi:hypothetical protein